MDCRQVYQYELNGKYITKHDSIAQAARVMGCNESSIRKVIDKYKNSCGFIWKSQGPMFNKLVPKFAEARAKHVSQKQYDTPEVIENLIKYGTGYDPKDVAFNKPKPKTPLQEIAEQVSIPVEDINHYWYKGKHFSVHVNNEPLPAEVQFKTLLDECKKEVKPIKKKLWPTNPSLLNCAVVNIYDAHLDKRDIRYKNRGGEQVDVLTQEITNGFIKLLEALLVNNPTTFVLPIGNDLFTTNGFMNTTKRGTPQDPTVPHEYTFKKGLSLIRKIIDTLTQYGEVYVPVIKGNHDEDSTYYLGTCLEVLYENNENVTIENSRKDRKYFQYEDNLLGFAHGDKLKNAIDKLPLTMATENPKVWGDTKYRVFFCGDLHHKQEFKFLRTKDYAGCEVKYLRSVSITDMWHDENGFIGIPRTLEGYIFDSKKGQIANYSINI